MQPRLTPHPTRRPLRHFGLRVPPTRDRPLRWHTFFCTTYRRPAASMRTTTTSPTPSRDIVDVPHPPPNEHAAGAAQQQVPKTAASHPFVCDICKNRYSRIDHLARHFRRRTKPLRLFWCALLAVVRALTTHLNSRY